MKKTNLQSTVSCFTVDESFSALIKPSNNNNKAVFKRIHNQFLYIPIKMEAAGQHLPK